FAGYVIANLVWSLGAAFSIGTSAYLYDALLEAGHESEFPRYIGRNTTIQLLSNAAGAFAGGLLVQAVGEIRLTLFVGAALNLAAVAIALTFAEPSVARTTEPTYAEQLRQGLRVVRRREGVALLIGLEVFLGITLYAMALFRPLYLQFLGLTPAEIALSISGFLPRAATGLLNLGLFLGLVTLMPCSYILVRWRTTVAPWPAVTPLPSRLVAGARVSRFHRLFERLSRLRP